MRRHYLSGKRTKEPPDPGLLLHLDIAHLVKHQLLNSISSLWGFEHCQTWNISKAYIYIGLKNFIMTVICRFC